MATPKIIPYQVKLRSTTIERSLVRPIVYTNDLRSAEFQFQVTDMQAGELSGATATTLLYMRDGSFFQNPKEDVELTGTTFSYLLKEDEGNHAGIARIQLVVRFNEGLDDEQNFPSQLYDFEIVNGLETQVAQQIMIHDWTTLTRDARKFIDDSTIEVNALKTELQNSIETANASLGEFDVALQNGIVAANLAEKLEDFEEINNSRLLSTERQLEQAGTEIVGTNLRIDNLIIPLSPENANVEVTDAHTSIVKGKTFATLSNRIEEAESDFNALVDSELNEDHIIRSVPNGVTDYYDSSLGVFKKNVGHTVLDGGETFDSFVSTSTNVYKMMITGWVTAKNAVQGNVTTFEAVNADSTLDKIADAIGGGGLLVNTIALSGDALHLYLEKTKVDGMVGATLLGRCKQYLTSKPIDLKYQLVTGVDINLPNELSANTQWIIKAFGDLTLLSSALISENETWEV